jgi:hypothetical protein
MAWGIPQWTVFCTALGAVATGVGAGFVYWQISDAAATLYSANSYTAQKDIIEAADRLLEAREQLRNAGSNEASKTKLLRANQDRLAIRLDSLVDAVAGLKANHAIKESTWAHILWGMCPTFSDKSYKLDDTLLSSTQEVCTQDTSLWKVKPQ